MPREAGLTFRGVPPLLWRRALRLACTGIAGEQGEATDVLRLATQRGLDAMELEMKLDPLDGRPVHNGDETAEQIGWRTWRAAYRVTYRRAYGGGASDGNVMKRIAATALASLPHLRPVDAPIDPLDLERLFSHRWRRYLADPGHAANPGAPGFLRDNAHGLQWFERGIPSYGSPWDKADSAEMPGPGIASPSIPGGRKRYAGRPGSGPSITHQKGDDWRPKGAPE